MTAAVVERRVSARPLTAFERHCLDIAGRTYRVPGAKETALYWELRLTPTRHAQIVNQLLVRREALEHAPGLVNRLRAAQARRMARWGHSNPPPPAHQDWLTPATDHVLADAHATAAARRSTAPVEQVARQLLPASSAHVQGLLAARLAEARALVVEATTPPTD